MAVNLGKNNNVREGQGRDPGDTGRGMGETNGVVPPVASAAAPRKPHGSVGDMSMALVQVAARLIQTMWPVAADNAKLSPLSFLVEQVLRHTKSTWSTTVISLVYLVRLYTALAEMRCSSTEQQQQQQQQQPSGGLLSPTSPLSKPSQLECAFAGPEGVQHPYKKTAAAAANANSNRPSLVVPACLANGLEYTICGRRMFIAALMLAHKYHQEPVMKNSSWARVTGLALAEINQIERQSLVLMKHRLHVRVHEYQNFVGWLSREFHF